MGNSYIDPDEQDDTQEEAQTPQGAPAAAPAYPAAPPLSNPVIRSFDSPAQPAQNTTPQPASAPDQPQPATPSVQPPRAAASAPQATSDTISAPPALPPLPYGAPAPVQVAFRPADAPPAPVPDEEDQRAQYARDQAANLKYHKAQGGQTEVLPTGQEVVKTDADGNPLYHPAVLSPLTRGDDGKAYRVSRDQYGNQHFFDLAQGAEGQDYHVDPQNPWAS